MLTRPQRRDNGASLNDTTLPPHPYRWLVRHSKQSGRRSVHSSESRPSRSWIDPTTATTLTTQDVLARIRIEFAFRNEIDALAQLSQSPNIASALLDALPTIEALFGRDTTVLLDVVRNPENPAEEPTLFALIQTSLEPDEARPLMRQFREAWWNEASASFRNELNFGLLYT